MAEKAESKLNSEFDALKEDVSKVSRDVSALMGLLKGLGSEQVDGAKESLGEEVEKRREEIRQALLGVKERGEGAAQGIEEEVTLHPMRSVLMAFGLGFVAAKLLRGK